MANRNVNTNNVIVGTVVSALTIGAIAATFKFLSTKPGQRFKRDLADKYNDFKDDVEDLIEDISEKVGYEAEEEAEDVTNRAKNLVAMIQNGYESLVDEDSQNLRIGIIAGGVLGGLLGLGAIYMMNRSDDSECELESSLSSRVCTIKKSLKDILETVQDRTNDAAEKVKSTTNTFQDVLDLATTGIQLWNTVKKKI